MHAGASVNARDHRKRTPLHVAAKEGHEQLLKFLLSKKADATVTDLDGNSPVDLAAKKQHANNKAVDVLLKHPGSSKKDNPVKRALKKAIRKGKEEGIMDAQHAAWLRTMTPQGYAQG